MSVDDARKIAQKAFNEASLYNGEYMRVAGCVDLGDAWFFGCGFNDGLPRTGPGGESVVISKLDGSVEWFTLPHDIKTKPEIAEKYKNGIEVPISA